MSAPLTNGQKRYLAQLSDRAFARQSAIGNSQLAMTAARAAFRHAQVILACHKHGLRCCSQDDYGAVKARFLHLLGEDGAAMKAHVHGASNEERVAEWKLFREIEAARDAGLTLAYVESISRRQFGRPITDTTAKQKWALLYTVRNRAAKKRGTRNAERGAETSAAPRSALIPFPISPAA